MKYALKDWRTRHRHPASLCLHLVGIPLIPAAGVIAVLQLIDGAWHLWWRPVAVLALSYLLQGIGHLIEGNDMGEVILLKRLLGKPYVSVSPRYQETARLSTTEPGRRAADAALVAGETGDRTAGQGN